MIAETKIIDLLLSSGIETFMERPKDATEEYCIVERTGSSSTDYVTTATIAVQSISGSLAKAAKLNEKVKKILLTADIEGISSIKLMSDYNFTNTAAKQHRYQAVYSVVTKEL